MSLYFFDFDDGVQHFVDPEGTEHATLEQAIEESVSVLALLTKDRLEHGGRREFVSTMRDDMGVAIYESRLSFSSTWLKAS